MLLEGPRDGRIIPPVILENVSRETKLGCEEVFGWKYVRTIVGFGRWTPGYEARFAASAPAARVLRLRGDRERARLLDGLARERPIGSASV